MPRYYFDLKNGRRIVDAVGMCCIDDKAAMAIADFKATQVGIDMPCNHRRHVAVLNANGDEIFKSPVRIKPIA